MDGSILLPIIVIVLFLGIFFLECLSTDIISAIVYAVPFFILFSITMAIFSEFQTIFQALISILAIVNVIMILGNLLKAVIS